MAVTAVVFSGRNGLDFSELRAGVLRIPEVMGRIREAQKILDALGAVHVDLVNVISASDEYFFRNIKLKALAAAIVQVGLFDRLQKSQRRADYLIGISHGDSAMPVAAGQMTFEDLIKNSEALNTLVETTLERTVASAAEPLPLLAGISLHQYRAVVRSGDIGATYAPVREGTLDLKKLISTLNEEFGVTRFITVGPASQLRALDYNQLGNDDIESLDSIELDPMLGWFWKTLRAHNLGSLALAQ
jgi:hypothetical protein